MILCYSSLSKLIQRIMPFALQYVKKRTYFRKELVFEYMNQKGPILGLAAGLEFILHSNESNTADAAKGSGAPLCCQRQPQGRSWPRAKVTRQHFGRHLRERKRERIKETDFEHIL